MPTEVIIDAENGEWIGKVSDIEIEVEHNGPAMMQRDIHIEIDGPLLNPNDTPPRK